MENGVRPTLDDYTFQTTLFANEDDNLTDTSTVTLTIPGEFTTEKGIYYIGVRPDIYKGKDKT